MRPIHTIVACISMQSCRAIFARETQRRDAAVKFILTTTLLHMLNIAQGQRTIRQDRESNVDTL
jgi:hypothetical protein